MSDESKQSRLMGALETLAKVLTPLVVFAVGSYYTYTQDRLEQEQKALDRCITLSKDLSSTSEVQKQISISLMLDQCRQYKALSAVTVPRLVETASNSNSAAVVESAKQAAITLSANTNVASQIATVVASLPFRIYVHIPDESKRAEYAEITKRLNLNIVPGKPPYSIEGIENVGLSRSPTSTQVRYFRSEDASVAQQIADQLVNLGVTGAKPSLSVGKAVPFQLEIWFAKPAGQTANPRANVLPLVQPTAAASPTP